MTDASDQLHAVAAGILIIPMASFENGIPNESHIMALIIKDHRIRSKITGLYPLLPDKMTVDRDKNSILTYTYGHVTNTMRKESADRMQRFIEGLG